MADNWLRIRVTKIVDPGNFVGQIGTDETFAQHNFFEEQISNYCQNVNEPQPDAEELEALESRLVLVKSIQHKKWVRGLLLNTDSETEEVDVMHIDYGTSEIVPLSRIVFNIPDEFTEEAWPRQGIMCGLADVRPIINSYILRAINLFKGLVEHVVLDCEVVSSSSDHPVLLRLLIIDDTGEGRFVSDILVSEGVARPCTTASPVPPVAEKKAVPQFDLSKLATQLSSEPSTPITPATPASDDTEVKELKSRLGGESYNYQSSDKTIGQGYKPNVPIDMIENISNQITEMRQTTNTLPQDELDPEIAEASKKLKNLYPKRGNRSPEKRNGRPNSDSLNWREETAAGADQDEMERAFKDWNPMKNDYMLNHHVFDNYAGEFGIDLSPPRLSHIPAFNLEKPGERSSNGSPGRRAGRGRGSAKRGGTSSPLLPGESRRPEDSDFQQEAAATRNFDSSDRGEPRAEKPDKLSGSQLENEHEWRKYQLERKIESLLMKRKGEQAEMIVMELTDIVYPKKSAFDGLPGPGEVYICLRKLMVHVINCPSYTETVLGIIDIIKDYPNFPADVSEMLWSLHNDNVMLYAEGSTLNARNYSKFLGRLYLMAEKWDIDSRDPIFVCVCNVLEKWQDALEPKLNSGEKPKIAASELTLVYIARKPKIGGCSDRQIKLYSDCVEALIRTCGHKLVLDLPSELTSLLSVVKRLLLSKCVSETLLDLYGMLCKLTAEDTEPSVKVITEVKDPVDVQENSSQTEFTECYEAEVQTEFEELEYYEEEEPMDDSYYEEDGVSADSEVEEETEQEQDEYADVQAMLTQLKMDHMMEMFMENAVRDSTLELEFSDLKELLKECGLKAGTIYEIRAYLTKKPSEDSLSMKEGSSTIVSRQSSVRSFGTSDENQYHSSVGCGSVKSVSSAASNASNVTVEYKRAASPPTVKKATGGKSLAELATEFRSPQELEEQEQQNVFRSDNSRQDGFDEELRVSERRQHDIDSPTVVSYSAPEPALAPVGRPDAVNSSKTSGRIPHTLSEEQSDKERLVYIKPVAPVMSGSRGHRKSSGSPFIHPGSRNSPVLSPEEPVGYSQRGSAYPVFSSHTLSGSYDKRSNSSDHRGSPKLSTSSYGKVSNYESRNTERSNTPRSDGSIYEKDSYYESRNAERSRTQAVSSYGKDSYYEGRTTERSRGPRSDGNNHEKVSNHESRNAKRSGPSRSDGSSYEKSSNYESRNSETGRNLRSNAINYEKDSNYESRNPDKRTARSFSTNYDKDSNYKIRNAERSRTPRSTGSGYDKDSNYESRNTERSKPSRYDGSNYEKVSSYENRNTERSRTPRSDGSSYEKDPNYESRNAERGRNPRSDGRSYEKDLNYESRNAERGRPPRSDESNYRSRTSSNQSNGSLGKENIASEKVGWFDVDFTVKSPHNGRTEDQEHTEGEKKIAKEGDNNVGQVEDSPSVRKRRYNIESFHGMVNNWIKDDESKLSRESSVSSDASAEHQKTSGSSSMEKQLVGDVEDKYKVNEKLGRRKKVQLKKLERNPPTKTENVPEEEQKSEEKGPRSYAGALVGRESKNAIQDKSATPSLDSGSFDSDGDSGFPPFAMAQRCTMCGSTDHRTMQCPERSERFLLN